MGNASNKLLERKNTTKFGNTAKHLREYSNKSWGMHQ